MYERAKVICAGAGILYEVHAKDAAGPNANAQASLWNLGGLLRSKRINDDGALDGAGLTDDVEDTNNIRRNSHGTVDSAGQGQKCESDATNAKGIRDPVSPQAKVSSNSDPDLDAHDDTHTATADMESTPSVNAVQKGELQHSLPAPAKATAEPLPTAADAAGFAASSVKARPAEETLVAEKSGGGLFWSTKRIAMLLIFSVART